MEFSITGPSGKVVGVVDVTNKGFSYPLGDGIDELWAQLCVDRPRIVRTLREGRQWVEFSPAFDHVIKVELLLDRYLEGNGYRLTEAHGRPLSATPTPRRR